MHKEHVQAKARRVAQQTYDFSGVNFEERALATSLARTYRRILEHVQQRRLTTPVEGVGR
jgi:AAA+ superfamily predicted ATPase